MNRTPHDNAPTPLPSDPDAADDFEILEVVGMSDDDEAGTGVEADEAEEAEVPEGGEDIEIVFDEDTAAQLPAPPVGVYSPPVEDADLRQRLLRLHADFDNFKKRVERERFDHFRYATFELVGRILPVLDNFERAMTAARPGAPSDALIEGLALIQRQLLTELEAEGLRGMESVGERFDPERHEAVATDPDSPVPPHTITQEFQRGYFLHDRVLRPAMVRVRVDESGDGTADGDR